MALLAGLLLLGAQPAAEANRPSPNHEVREASVGIEGRIERILNEPDYQTVPQRENDALLLRIESVERTIEGQFKYTFAFMGLQSGVFNLADFLQTPSGKRLRDVIPAMSVTVRALLPEDAGADLAPMPQALPPRRIPYHLSLAVLCLLWAGAGWFLYYKPRPKPLPPPPAPPPPAPPKSLGEILEPLALKAARKTITTEEKVLLEQTVLRYWSEKLEIGHLDADQQYELIREDPEGGVLLSALERWLYQPASLILTTEVTKALKPYFDIPAPGSGPLPTKKKKPSLFEDDDEEDEDNHDAPSSEGDDEDDDAPSKPSADRGGADEDEDEAPEAPPEPPPAVGRRPGYRRRR
jgi:hypothetical protein